MIDAARDTETSEPEPEGAEDHPPATAMEGPGAGTRQQENDAAHQQSQQGPRGVAERERLTA
eukprot:4453931-Lingulodinium_polyedra.AAC.1